VLGERQGWLPAREGNGGRVSGSQDIDKAGLDAPPRLGIAVLGCGYWGINYVRVFSELHESRVCVVCDKRPDRLREVERRFPWVETTTDIEKALRLDGVDAAIICTEATTHYNAVQQCLEAGKHVLVEKPLSTSVVDAEALIAKAETTEKILMVGHTFIYNPGIRKIKEYIATPGIGRIYYLYSSRTNLGPIRRDVNALWDLAPHDVAIFNFLLDSTPEWVSAVGVRALRNGLEDVGFVALGYPNGVVGHIHVSWADPNKVRELVIVSSDKRIAFNDLDPVEQVRIFEKSVAPVEGEASSYGEYQFLVRDGDIISPRVEVSEPLKNQCNHFLECVAQRSLPLTSARDGLSVVRVMDAIDRSLEARGAPIKVASGENACGLQQSNDTVSSIR
jgi:predicted dehydrogenase